MLRGGCLGAGVGKSSPAALGLWSNPIRSRSSRLIRGAYIRSVGSVLLDQPSFISPIARLDILTRRAAERSVNSGFPRLVAPVAFELPQVGALQHEIFGPVLHVVRWRGEPDQLVREINALGFGLTFGIQTRIDSRAERLAKLAHIGNVYVNRNMIGAVVGVQPFGGEGLSGTGPKAGGPHYLYRFCAEQTLTINTTAAGGNVALLA